MGTTSQMAPPSPGSTGWALPTTVQGALHETPPPHRPLAGERSQFWRPAPAMCTQVPSGEGFPAQALGTQIHPGLTGITFR